MDNMVLGSASSIDIGTAILDPAKSEIMSTIGTALPVAGAVFGTLAAVMLGVKFFKKITGARA